MGATTQMLEKIITFSFNILQYDRVQVVHFYNRFEDLFKKATQKVKTSFLVAGMVLVPSPTREINVNNRNKLKNNISLNN